MRTILNGVFWIAIAFDWLLLAIFGLLAMAAAPNAKPGYAREMIPMFLIPTVLLVGAIIAYIRSPWAVLRGASLLLALSPWLLVAAVKLRDAMKEDVAGKLV